jgi:hypothetical protein
MDRIAVACLARVYGWACVHPGVPWRNFARLRRLKWREIQT